MKKIIAMALVVMMCLLCAVCAQAESGAAQDTQIPADFQRDSNGRLNLTRELSVDAAAVGETTLHAARWRSDGTADQLYFALRLAVAEELTPQAPLVLDDALVRFDDHRLEKAMEILRDAAERRQVIVFTCQDRESRFDSRGEQ